MSGSPFFFDGNIFDEESPDFYDKKISQEQELKHTDEQVRAIKKQAYEEGRLAGIKEAEGNIVRQIHTLISTIQRDVSKLFEEEKTRIDIYENETVHLSLKIYKKLFPLLNKDFGVKEIESSISTALQEHRMPERINIELHPEILKEIEVFLTEQEVKFDKSIKLVESSNLSGMEYRILWPEGGIIYNRDSIAQKTAEIMQEALAENGIKVHDDNVPPIDSAHTDTDEQGTNNTDTIKE